MARRTKDEAEQTRNAILDAAESEFYEHGVARTSLQEVAKAAGVTRGAVYWHFRDKMELCEAMADRVFLPQEDVIERLATSETPAPLESLECACVDALQLMAKDKQRNRVFSILTHRCEYVEEMAAVMRRRHECKDRMLDQSRRIFERAKKLKHLSPHWTPRVAAACLQALMHGLIVNGLERPKNFNLAKTGRACVESFFSSLKARTGRKP